MTRGTLAISLLLAVAVPPRSSAESTLPKTGQKKCYSVAGAKIACTGTHQDGADRAGRAIELADGGNGTLADANTRLVWEKQSRDGTVHDRDALYTWQQAADKITQLNTPPCFAGLCTWRLPNIKELQSVVDYDRKRPALAKAFLKKCKPGCTVTSCSCTVISEPGSLAGFWSSTTNRSVPGEAWQLEHATGASISVPKGATGAARAVAAPVCQVATVTVSVTYGAGVTVSGVTAAVDYPPTLTEIPGCCSNPSVLARISNLTGIANGIFSAGDSDSDADALDDRISVGLVSLSSSIPAGPFADIRLDCTAGEAPLVTDFACTLDASDGNGDPVEGSCAVKIRYE
jgi:hypothetical protein